MHRHHLRSFVAAAALLFAGALGAQDSAAIAIGARLRVQPRESSAWREGRFGGFTADSLVLRDRHGESRYALGQLASVEELRRDRSARSRNMTIGAVAGALASVVVLDLAIRHCERKNPNSDGPPCSLGWTALPVWAIGSAGIGAIAGAAWPAHRWRPVRLYPRPD